MRPVTTLPPIEKLNPNRHKLIMVVKEKPFTVFVSGESIGKTVYMPGTLPSDIPPISHNELRKVEEDGYTLYSITQEEFKDICTIICTSLHKEDFNHTMKQWLTQKLSKSTEIVVINE